MQLLYNHPLGITTIVQLSFLKYNVSINKLPCQKINQMYYSSHTPKLLSRLNCEFKCENNKRTRSCGCSLACNSLGIKGCVKASGWGLRRGTSKSITHTNLHKPNNKLVSAQLEHFWYTNESRENINSLRPGLGGSHHLPLYNILCVSP